MILRRRAQAVGRARSPSTISDRWRRIQNLVSVEPNLRGQEECLIAAVLTTGYHATAHNTALTDLTEEGRRLDLVANLQPPLPLPVPTERTPFTCRRRLCHIRYGCQFDRGRDTSIDLSQGVRRPAGAPRMVRYSTIMKIGHIHSENRRTESV